MSNDRNIQKGYNYNRATSPQHATAFGIQLTYTICSDARVVYVIKKTILNKVIAGFVKFYERYDCQDAHNCIFSLLTCVTVMTSLNKKGIESSIVVCIIEIWILLRIPICSAPVGQNRVTPQLV